MQTRIRACVVGDSGLLGQAFVQEIAGAREGAVLGISSSSFEPNPYWRKLSGTYEHLTLALPKAEASLRAQLDAFAPTLLVNCAALSNIVGCEQNPELSRQLNVELPLQLARIAKERGIPFLQFSTDQVFDGTKRSKYNEGDQPTPLHVYGRHKREMEESLLESVPRNTLVLRTNIVGFRDLPAKGSAFVEWLTNSLQARSPITLFDDFVTSPFHVADCALLSLELAKSGFRGLLHLASRDAVSKWTFGMEFAKAIGLGTEKVAKKAMADAPMQPPRPLYVGLEVAKAEELLKRQLPTFQETLERLTLDYQHRHGRSTHPPFPRAKCEQA